MNYSLNKKLFPTVKNIIFDLGGVIVNLDYHITINALKRLGFKGYDGTYLQLYANSLFDKNDIGTISKEDFVNGILNASNAGTTAQQVIDAWNAMLLDLPAKRVALLQNLKQNYRTFLLSNTNELHLDYFFNYVETEFSGLKFDTLFEKPHYSCRMGMRKPNVEIYQAVIDQNQLNPSETLFIDDVADNLTGAAQAGMHTYHLPKGHDLFELFCVE
jgi:putative hydrolase of the HAD superfamily